MSKILSNAKRAVIELHESIRQLQNLQDQALREHQDEIKPFTHEGEEYGALLISGPMAEVAWRLNQSIVYCQQYILGQILVMNDGERMQLWYHMKQIFKDVLNPLFTACPHGEKGHCYHCEEFLATVK